MNIEVPSSEKIEQLETLLAKYKAGVKNCSEMNGIFAAMVCLTEEWDENEILNRGCLDSSDSVEAFRARCGDEYEELRALAMEMWESVKKGITTLMYLPLYTSGGGGKYDPSDWLEGVFSVMASDFSSWAFAREKDVPSYVSSSFNSLVMYGTTQRTKKNYPEQFNSADRKRLEGGLADIEKNGNLMIEGLYVYRKGDSALRRDYEYKCAIDGELSKMVEGIMGGSGISSKKVGRNDQCSCGSGKKYKKCCLNK